MLRSIAKDTAARVASWTGIDAAARKSVRRDTPYVVGYHRVVDQLDRHKAVALPAMEITTRTLEKHLDWIGTHFQIVPIEELANRRSRSKPFAAITFDDGYADVFLNAFPLLERKGIPAAFFVVTDLIGTTIVPAHDRLFALLSNAAVGDAFAATQNVLSIRRHDDVLRIVESLESDMTASTDFSGLQPMSWEMLREMRDAGMTIGSHSKTHAFLTNETPERVAAELKESRATLQQKLGIAADSFAYPGGAFSRSVVEAVDAAGYRFAFTDCRHRDERYPLLTIRRRGLWERSCLDRFGEFSPAIMSCHSAAIFDRLSRCQKDH